jgi:hypothetical protein
VSQGFDVRASDEDRDRTARILREHFAAGRLTSDELDERVQAAYGAATDGQLRALIADLPALPVSPQQQRAELAARRGELQRRLWQETGASLVPFAVCSVIWVASGATGMFWPVFVLLAALIPLLRGGWQLYGPSPDLEAFERDLEQRRQRRSERRERRSDRRGRR